MTDELERAEDQPKRWFRMPSVPALPDLGAVPLLGKLKHVDEPADEQPAAGEGEPKGERRRLNLPGVPELPDVKELATHLSELFPAPSPHLLEPWEVSLASLVDKVPHVPDIAIKALGLLDGFGAVHIGPRKVGFDGDEIEWDKVVALRTRRVSDMISGAVLEREVDRLRQYLPPVPGRKWAVGKAVDLLVVLSMVALEDQLEVVLGLVDGAHGFDAAADRVTRDGRVVSEIVYKGWVRKEKELQAGLLASAVLAQVHGADHCLREMAAARGIPVVQAEDGNDLEDAAEKAAAIRRRIEELSARIPMLRKDPAADGAAEIVDDPVANIGANPADNFVYRIGDDSVDSCVGNPVDNRGADPVDNPVDEIVDNRVDNRGADPVDDPVANIGANPADDFVYRIGDDSVDNRGADPVHNPVDNRGANRVDNPVDNRGEELT